ncbi:MAG: hypothetical protein HFJ33_01935 [Clostridia bacterium]|nr:hypothetical protein [Clostridia bacterium]
MRKIKDKKYYKIMIIAILVILFISILPNTSFMSNTSKINSKMLGDLDQYASQEPVSSKLQDKVGVLLGVFQTGGSAIAVVCLIVLGVKYMMGSVEEKAEYKKTLVPYAIGAMMVFAISNFLNIFYQIATSI